MTGNAEMAAEAIKEVFQDNDLDVKLRRMEKVNLTDFAEISILIVCSSTYGEGDVPDNGKPLYEQLQENRPDLSHMSVAVFGLGDQKNYPATYNNGGKRWDDLLCELGTLRLIERYRHDASSGEFADEAAEEWAENLIGKF